MESKPYYLKYLEEEKKKKMPKSVFPFLKILVVLSLILFGFLFSYMLAIIVLSITSQILYFIFDKINPHELFLFVISNRFVIMFEKFRIYLAWAYYILLLIAGIEFSFRLIDKMRELNEK